MRYTAVKMILYLASVMYQEPGFIDTPTSCHLESYDTSFSDELRHVIMAHNSKSKLTNHHTYVLAELLLSSSNVEMLASDEPNGEVHHWDTNPSHSVKLRENDHIAAPV